MEYVIVSLAAMVVAGLTFFSGFGLGTLMMPVFAVFFPVEIAIAATALVHLANNVFKVVLVGRHGSPGVVALFALPASAAAVLGALLLNHFLQLAPFASYVLAGKVFFITPAKVAIAALIIFFAGLELSPRLKKLSIDRKYIPLGGVLSGFFGGLSGHQGALRSAFLVRAGLDKKALIGTMVLSAVVVDVSRLAVYGLTFFQRDFAVLQDQGGINLVLAGSLSAFVGSFLGSRLLDKMTLSALQFFIAVMLFLLAVALGLGIV